MVLYFYYDKENKHVNRDHSPLLPFGGATVPLVVTCAFESQRRLYLNVNLMTALTYKTWMVQTLKLN
jgi:hypothetical protein